MNWVGLIFWFGICLVGTGSINAAHAAHGTEQGVAAKGALSDLMGGHKLPNVVRFIDGERDATEKELELIAQQQARLAEDTAKGRIAQAVYNVRKQELERKEQRLREELDRRNKFLDKANDIGLAAAKGIIEGALAKERAEQDLKLAVGTAAAKQALENRGAMERFQALLAYLADKKNLARFGGTIAATAAGVFISYHGLRVAANYIEAHLDKPQLVSETSRHTIWTNVKEFLRGAKDNAVTIENVILPEKQRQQLDTFAQVLKNARFNGRTLPSAMFVGPPGTGKTYALKQLAEYADLDYAVIKGNGFAQFSKAQAHHEMAKLFTWLEAGSRPTILFIDEADALLLSRKDADDETRSLLNKFLSYTGTRSPHWCIVITTNLEEKLSAAVKSRIRKRIVFELPGLEERYKILKQEFDRQVADNASIMIAVDINESFLRQAVTTLEGWSGRDLYQAVLDMFDCACLDKHRNTVTREVFEHCLGEVGEQIKLGSQKVICA